MSFSGKFKLESTANIPEAFKFLGKLLAKQIYFLENKSRGYMESRKSRGKTKCIMFLDPKDLRKNLRVYTQT